MGSLLLATAVFRDCRAQPMQLCRRRDCIDVVVREKMATGAIGVQQSAMWIAVLVQPEPNWIRPNSVSVKPAAAQDSRAETLEAALKVR